MRVNAQRRVREASDVGEKGCHEVTHEDIPEVVFVKLEPLDESMGNGSQDQAMQEPDEIGW